MVQALVQPQAVAMQHVKQMAIPQASVLVQEMDMMLNRVVP
jgi:hypothetical protein